MQRYEETQEGHWGPKIGVICDDEVIFVMDSPRDDAVEDRGDLLSERRVRHRFPGQKSIPVFLCTF